MKFKKSILQESLNYLKPVSALTRLIDLNNPKLKKIEAELSGSYRSIQKSNGFDFREIREYVMGDDLRHISWKSTAKTNTLQTKEYTAEKEIRSFFLIDISNSMICGKKLQTLILSLTYLLNLCCGFSEKIGGLLYSNEIKNFIPLANSTNQANVLLNSIFNFHENLDSQLVSNFGITNITQALNFAKSLLRKKGLIFIISDFINISNFEKSMFEASQKQNIYAIQISDPIDFEIPKIGYANIINPETKENFLVNTDSKIVREAFKTLVLEKQKKFNGFLKSVGVHYFELNVNDFPSKV